MNYFRANKTHGFTLVEMVFGIIIVGVLLLAIMNIFGLFQKGSTQTHQAADAQQGARIALDYITDNLRQAGSGTDYVRGQRFVVFAGPYQVAFNADLDNSAVVAGQNPLAAINLDYTPTTVPASGTSFYTPNRVFDSPSETVVLTLDSDADGEIDSADKGDDAEEGGHNTNLYMLKRYVYGFDGNSSNDVRDTDLALVRGPEAFSGGGRPTPLFQYWYDDDDDQATDVALWGDTSGDNKLDQSEIGALTEMPANLLSRVRKVRVTVTSQGSKPNKKFKNKDGFMTIEMNSEVYLRNALRSNSLVFGKVYFDENNNGLLDTGETGIPDVEVRLVGIDRKTKTNGAGDYYFPVGAGNFTVREYDPSGYSSTTNNVVAVSLQGGQSVQVNFGDDTSGPVGYIQGTVYDDQDADGIMTGGEPGLAGVTVSLDSGEIVNADDNGFYSFTIPVGTYTVVEIDPTGYGSTTPNDVEVTLTSDGEVATVDFGDISALNSGTLEGYVFEDTNGDGDRDGGESGLPDVKLTLDNGDSTRTNAVGFYQFTLNPGTYDISEQDPAGYTSATVNVFQNVLVEADKATIRDFGDIEDQADDFIEIVIGNTGRALSVSATDFEEDTRSDVDIIVGTPYAGSSGNMLVFHNNRKNSNTSLSALFDATPTYTRDAGNHVNTIGVYDFTSDGYTDVLTGLEYASSDNVQVWNDDNNGVLSTAPNQVVGSQVSTYVMAAELADVNGDGTKDALFGLRNSSGVSIGGFEVFYNYNGSLVQTQSVTSGGSSGLTLLGEIWAIDSGDVDGDGDVDVVVGSKTGPITGFIDVFHNDGYGYFQWHSRYVAPGAVNALVLIDMKEDDQNDVDILVGTTTAPNAGLLAMYTNDRGAFGMPDATGITPPADITLNTPSDFVVPGGEVLSIVAGYFNADVFPEVFLGTRNSASYDGDMLFLETFGSLPSSALKLNRLSIGRVVSMYVADFNNDNLLDVVVGTQTGASQGKVLIYFYEG